MFTEQRALWLYDHFLWLEKRLPQRPARGKIPLVTPTPDFYPQRKTGDDAFAESIFATTKSLMGVSEWRCRLRGQSENAHDRDAALSASGVYGQTEHAGAAGTFQVGEDVLITYSPRLVHDPLALVATFAHELCHYLMATIREEPPCGWKQHEPLTDLAAVVEGFGLFLCASAFQFSQWSDHKYHGWRWRKQGYLNEAELGFALGVFCVRSGVEPDVAGPYLKLNPGEVFWDSIEYVRDLERTRHAG